MTKIMADAREQKQLTRKDTKQIEQKPTRGRRFRKKNASRAQVKLIPARSHRSEPVSGTHRAEVNVRFQALLQKNPWTRSDGPLAVTVR